MEQQLDELKAKVEKSQQAMVDYERQNVIVNIGDKQTVVEQRLAALSQDLTDAQNERMQKESLYDLVRSNESQAALIAQNELLQRLDEKYADLRDRYVDALAQYGPNFPKVVRLRDQVNEVQSIMERERKRVVARIRNDYMAALGRERLLSAAVAQEKVEVGKLSQLLIEHNILKREFDTNQQLYDSLLQHLKDATVSAGLRATNIHLVDSALIPTVPVRPRIMYNIAVGMLVGLVLGVTLAFVQESLDTSVKSAEDVERLIAAPALAVIPHGALVLAEDGRGQEPATEWVGGIDRFETTHLIPGRVLPHPAHGDSALDCSAPSTGFAGDQRSAGRGQDFHLAQPGLGARPARRARGDRGRRHAPTGDLEGAGSLREWRGAQQFSFRRAQPG